MRGSRDDISAGATCVSVGASDELPRVGPMTTAPPKIIATDAYPPIRNNRESTGFPCR